MCNSLTGDYKIIEEIEVDSLKDTSRMLKAGAKKAYLLLVSKCSLKAGILAVLEIIPDNALIIIESNTIRKVIEPGLFLVIKEQKNNSVKPSCAEVIKLSDKIIQFDNMNWDFLPDKVEILDRNWIIKE